MYCDFVRQRGTRLRRALPHVCRPRPGGHAHFFGDRLLLRSLVLLCPATYPPSYARRLAPKTSSAPSPVFKPIPQMQMALNMQITSIDTALEPESEGPQFIADLGGQRPDPGRQVVGRSLVEGLRKRGLENQVKWFHSTGGNYEALRNPGGTLRARSTWRYAPTDELLTAFLACALSRTRRASHNQGAAHAGPFLLVTNPLRDPHRPTTRGLDSADARAGAAENLDAFTTPTRSFWDASRDFPTTSPPNS